MADIDTQPQVDTQNQEDFLNMTPVKNAKLETNQEVLDQTVETEAQSPDQHQQSPSEIQSPEQSRPSAHAEPAEISRDLKKLHHKVDEILNKHYNPLYKSNFLPTTYYATSLRNSAVSAYEPVRSSYVHLGHIEHKPRYDEQKLDQIVSKILGVSYAPAVVSHQERTSYKQAAPVVKPAKKSVPHFCGEVENDMDSIIIDHIRSVGQEVEENHQNYNNFYVGSLNDDIDEQPRNKRIGKRQQVSQSKKPINDNELMKKSVYDQRNNQKASNEQAKRALAAGGAAHEDFDFARAQNVKRA